MKRTLTRTCTAPIHREHLRTASIITTVEMLVNVGATLGIMAIVISVITFAWELLFIVVDAEKETENVSVNSTP